MFDACWHANFHNLKFYGYHTCNINFLMILMIRQKHKKKKKVFFVPSFHYIILCYTRRYIIGLAFFSTLFDI